MTHQVEMIADELDTEELDLAVGGLSCRKAGGDGNPYATSGDESIIAVL